MATVVYSARALDHLERAFGFLRDESPEAVPAAVAAISSAADALANHPLLGRRVEGDIRELVISYGRTGHIALYRFLIASDEVRILALRHQRELGYAP